MSHGDVGKCRGCGEPVLFVPTAATGSLIPLNPKTEKRVLIGDDGKARVVDTWISHFATCAHAAQFRKKKERS